MLKRCQICNKAYSGKHRGWYEYYIPPVCSSACFARLCREGYPELRFAAEDPRTKVFLHSDRSFRSSYEKSFNDSLTKEGLRSEFEPRVFYLLDKSGYVPDFLVENKVFVEVKGIWLGDGKKKFLAFREEFTDIPIYLADKEFLTMLRSKK